MKRLGKLRIAEELLLRWLDYRDASIRGVTYDAQAGAVDIILAHSSMPEVHEGVSIPWIHPTYITYEDALGNKVTLRDKNKD